MFLFEYWKSDDLIKIVKIDSIGTIIDKLALIARSVDAVLCLHVEGKTTLDSAELDNFFLLWV